MLDGFVMMLPQNHIVSCPWVIMGSLLRIQHIHQKFDAAILQNVHWVYILFSNTQHKQ